MVMTFQNYVNLSTISCLLSDLIKKSIKTIKHNDVYGEKFVLNTEITFQQNKNKRKEKDDEEDKGRDKKDRKNY